MSVKISKSNSKLGVIPSVNLPPITSCRPRCPCAGDCYATKGRFLFANVKASMENNYQAYIADPHKYFQEITDSIDNGLISYSYFRWHAAGDIIDPQYLVGMIQVAESLPRTSFLAFTKKFEIINDYISSGGSIPSNLHIVFSAWGNELEVDNPYSFPTAYVRFKDETRNSSIPASATQCSGNCSNCLQCWKITRGQAVVFDKH